MASVNVYNIEGKKTDIIELNDKIFGIEVNKNAVYMSVVQYLANQRQGTKCTKTRAEVRGGGKKPWRQKGTGRARQGSIRSPQWVGGGVVFAPKPRDYSFKLNKKLKRLALKSVLSSKLLENKIIVLEDFKLNEIKTKNVQNIINNFNIDKALIVLGEDKNNRNIILSARNISNIKTAGVNTINVYDILKFDTFVITKQAINKVQEVYA